MKKFCCPMCGSEGVEKSRQSTIHKGKLYERVELYCDLHQGRFVEFDDSIRDYSKEDRLSKMRRKRGKPAKRVVSSADAISNVHPVLEAEDRALNRKLAIRSRIRKFGE